jgi:glucokinase
MKSSAPLVLAADVGGTNARIGLGRYDGEHVSLLARRVYPTQTCASLEAAIDVFLDDPEVAASAAAVEGACFAVAGPVTQGRARLTNRGWTISEEALSAHLGLDSVRVINDFAAAGVGIGELEEEDFLALQHGSGIEHGVRVIVGAGTGLGVAVLLFEEGRYRVHPSEAGHGSFAPGTASHDALLRYLRGRLSHVSYERVVSGQGPPAILDFLADTEGCTPSRELTDAMAQGDSTKAIAQFALENRDVAAVRALDLFVSAYGTFAGNMALAVLAHGGVFVGGGIAPKIAAKLEDGTFVRAFCAKGRFQPLLETIPVKIVMNEHVGLYGALVEAGRAV